MFGEETCNASCNKFIPFLNEVELVICNSRRWNLSGLEWVVYGPGAMAAI